jgi:YfiH family protein
MTQYQTHDLLTSPGVTHGFFTRSGGVSQGAYESLNVGRGSDDDPAHVHENRSRVAGALGTSESHLLGLWQCHSRDVLIVSGPLGEDRPKADGLVTKTPGLALSALAADCVPVLLSDPKAGVIGACHAGWRGALSGITDETIRAMQSLGAKPDNIRAVLGPCISAANYEVGPEFRDTFVAEDEVYDRFFELGPPNAKGERRPHFDLNRFVLMRLRRAGLSRIDALPDCTYGQPEDYFSYRYNSHHGVKDYGRNISAIMLT